MQTLNNRISLHRSYIKLPENRKLYASKHLYEWNNGMIKTANKPNRLLNK